MRNIILFLVLTTSTVSYAQDSNRLALVIGNANYQYGGSLQNPVNDANLIATTLSQLGFDVIIETDAGLNEMQTAFKAFAGKLSNYDVALFFYAGHGMQVNGENYLIPVDAKIEDKMSLDFEAFKVAHVNKYFSYRPNKMNIMILDACRNNPYRSWMRGGGEGFSAVKDQGAGTIIAFATREGETASDGSDSNGLFTKNLVEQMTTPQSITDVFLNTRIGVMNESNGQQVPQEWNMLTANFYFTDKKSENGGNPILPKTQNSNNANERSNSSQNLKDIATKKLSDSRDGKQYNLVLIGDKIWMAENLDFETRKGSWVLETKHYQPDYGRLYNWQTAKEVCPEGWHLPSVDEWEELISKMGGRLEAGGRLKSTSTSWKPPNTNATNESGFAGLPGGTKPRMLDNAGNNGTMRGFWWSSNISSDKWDAYFYTLVYNSAEIYQDKCGISIGLSVRCIMD